MKRMVNHRRGYSARILWEEWGALVLNACWDCGGDLKPDDPTVWDQSTRATCQTCGREMVVQVDEGALFAGVAAPYGCRDWRAVTSSNVDAVGRNDRDLFVRFKKNGFVYRYDGAADHFEGLVAAESVGKYFAQHVRARPAVKLCPTYSCRFPVGECPVHQ